MKTYSHNHGISSTVKPMLPWVSDEETPYEASSTALPFFIDVNVPSYLLNSYLVIGATGVGGNLLVFCVLIINISKCKNITEKLLLHQTIIDGLTSAWVILNAVFPAPSSYSVSPTVWEDFLCRVWATQLPMWMGFSSSCFNLVAITFEQYFEIVHPVFHKVHLQRIRIAVPVSLVWFFSAVCNILSFVPVSSIVDKVCLAWASFPNSLAASVTGVSYLLYYLAVPASMMIGCFCHMIYVVHKKTRVTVPLGTIAFFNQTKLNMLKTLIIFGVTYICCWSYNIWVFRLGIFMVIDASFYLTWEFHLSVLLLFASCSINPFIYAINYKKFWQNLKICVEKVSCRFYRS